MIKVVPITYDINVSQLAHTEEKSIQTGMIIHWYVQIAHTTVALSIYSHNRGSILTVLPPIECF